MQFVIEKPAASPQRWAAQTLLETIQVLAENASNPVLELLNSRTEFFVEHKYPPQGLAINQDRIRLFYHCHESPAVDPHEHGHFHIFSRLADEEEWSHLVALSMDNHGQPLAWFTVNHWVTGGKWLTPENLLSGLELVSVSEFLVPRLERWILAMLSFYQPRFHSLLEQRDEKLAMEEVAAKSTNVLQDRRLYVLSNQPIDLLHDLAAALKLDA